MPDRFTTASAKAHLAIPAILLLLIAMFCASSAVADQRKTILIVFDENRDLPGLAMISESLRGRFKAELGDNVEFWSEGLSLSQFKGDMYEEVLRDYFRGKYQTRRPDLIVAVMQPSLDFLLRNDQELFPGVPIVFCGVDASYLDNHVPPPNVTGVMVKRDYAPTLDIALSLQPDTRNVYVIGGTSPFDLQIRAIARENLAPYSTRVNIQYLTDLPMSDLLDTVARLPGQSVVIYLTLFADGAGRAFVPHDALARICAAANAPVFVAVDQYLDRGAVGGHLYSVSTHGRHAAEIGLKVLKGEAPPVIEQAAYRDVFDWRQLKRWGFDARRLPPGSELRNRTRSLWDTYKWYIVGILTVSLLQTGLIVALLVSRRQRERAAAAARDAEARRRQAEEVVQRQRDELAHALRLTTLGELSASFAHELGQPLTAILMNAQTVHRLSGDGRLTPAELNGALHDIEQDALRAADTIQRLRRLFRKEKAQRTRVDMNEIIGDVVRLLHEDLRAKDIHVQIDYGDDLPGVIGDPVQLRQVVLNLLINAKDAMTREPQDIRGIFVETRVDGDDKVAVVVRDSGIGTDRLDLERMFEPFASTKPNGLGMGLAISRSIVEAHRGRIWAEPNPDRGLTLHIELPGTVRARPLEATRGVAV